jgi:hypothetical protein
MRDKASEESSGRNLSRSSRFRCVEPTRRDVTCGGALAAFGLLLTDLLGTASPVKADAFAGPVPTLDRVAVRIVTEDYQFAVAPGRKEDGLVVENFGWGIGPDHPPGRTLVSEFGLSMHVESRRGDETRQVLIDFGFTPEADFQYRSGLHFGRRGFRQQACDGRRRDFDGRTRPLHGQHFHQFLDELLQFSAPSPGDEQPDADGGVARRHGQNRGGGEGCGYAASLGQRKRVAHIPTAEAARSGLILEGQRQAPRASMSSASRI